MAKIIAFYLPQYHPTPENNEWWGEGFTDWRSVNMAKPLFRGHIQPKIPADLGYYDLRLEETRIQQGQMAQEYGIDAFCYWHYWFGGGKRLLNLPFDEVVKTGKPSIPFCLGWANHSWYKKAWGGQGKDKLLIEQKYPGIEDYIPQEEEEEIPYKTVEEAVVRIKELEVEIEQLKQEGSANSDYIAELEAASQELAEYKANEAAFEEEKEKFYEEVVFSDKAPDINEYKSYYESIEPDNAEAIYKQVVSQLQTDAEIEDYIKVYSSMKPKNAAAIFDTMTDDFDLVCEILSSMDAATRADIISAMSTENAAIITKMMEP